MPAQPPKAVQERRAREARNWHAARRQHAQRVLEAEPRLVDLARRCRAGTVPEMLAEVRKADWLRRADAETRVLAMHLLAAPIEAARKEAGKDALEDPAPGEPDDGWLEMRALLTAPTPAPRPTEPARGTRAMTYIDMIACRVHNGADFSKVEAALDRIFAPMDGSKVVRQQAAQDDMPPAVTVGRAEEAAEMAETDAPPTTDKNGLPWDERIHSSNKALNADGTWRRRRGVDDDTVAQVEAELKGEDAPEPGAEEQPSEDADLDAMLGGETEAPKAEYVIVDAAGDKMGAFDTAVGAVEAMTEALADCETAADLDALTGANQPLAKAFIAADETDALDTLRKAVADRKAALTKPAAQDAAPGKTYELAEVRAALQAYAKTVGVAGLQKLFGEFGAKSIGDLKAEDYPAIMAKVAA